MAPLETAGDLRPDAEEYRRKLRRAGIDEDSDLYEILTVSHAAARSAEVAVREGARGLSPEVEKQLADRVAHDMVSRAERLFGRRTSWLALRTALAVVGGAALVAAATGVACYWLGERSGLAQSQEMAGEFKHFLATNPAGAAFLLRLIPNNDFIKAKRSDACQKTLREVDGWLTCGMPLWLEPVGKPAR